MNAATVTILEMATDIENIETEVHRKTLDIIYMLEYEEATITFFFATNITKTVAE